jgi:tRNA pseudouridine55 synthase
VASEQATGLLLLDKPAGSSSFAAIARLRPVLGRKLGHAGTLDPFATGLLLVLAGRATRLASFIVGQPKRYHATVTFGMRSTTADPEGELTAGGGRTTRAEVEAALGGFRGTIDQVPPAASAVHVDGERAYARFRRGETVTVPTRRVTIAALTLVTFDELAQTAELDVRCSTGTYIRALARDLGEELGVGAYCSALRRTEIGAFGVDDAASPAVALAEPFGGPHWRAPIAAVPYLATRDLTAPEFDAIGHGRVIPGDGTGPVALRHEGRLVAIANAVDGSLRPSIVLETAG